MSELRTAGEFRMDDAAAVAICTEGGVQHDFRPYEGEFYGRPHTYLRCVWCHAVTCGDYDQEDPCMEPYHHGTAHRARSGVTWPIGGNRPDTGLPA